MSVTKSIIRPWWGSRDRTDNPRLRRNRRLMEHTLRCVLSDTYQVPFVTYVFGKDNYKFLKSEGLEDLILVNDDPNPRNSYKRNYIHRLDICHAALEDFDQIVCVNWNCRLIKPFPDDFWDQLNKKESLQAPLIKTRVNILKSREGKANRIFPNDAFIYMRDKSLPNKLLDVLNWDNVSNKWTAESLMAHYLDHKHNGWIGTGKYYDLYEPDFIVSRGSVFKNKKENVCFTLKSKTN